jgi:hypothetical protein
MSKRSLDNVVLTKEPPKKQAKTTGLKKKRGGSPSFPSYSYSSSSSISDLSESRSESSLVEEKFKVRGRDKKHKKEENSSSISLGSSSSRSSSTSSSSHYSSSSSKSVDDDDDDSSSSLSLKDEEKELIRINSSKKIKWFKENEDVIFIGRSVSKVGPLKDVNKMHKEKEDFSVKLNTITNGKKIYKVKSPYGSIDQELYNHVFTLKSKIASGSGEMIYAIIKNEESDELFMIDCKFFSNWFDDECNKRYDEYCQYAKKKTTKSKKNLQEQEEIKTTTLPSENITKDIVLIDLKQSEEDYEEKKEGSDEYTQIYTSNDDNVHFTL